MGLVWLSTDCYWGPWVNRRENNTLRGVWTSDWGPQPSDKNPFIRHKCFGCPDGFRENLDISQNSDKTPDTGYKTGHSVI